MAKHDRLKSKAVAVVGGSFPKVKIPPSGGFLPFHFQVLNSAIHSRCSQYHYRRSNGVLVRLSSECTISSCLTHSVASCRSESRQPCLHHQGAILFKYAAMCPEQRVVWSILATKLSGDGDQLSSFLRFRLLLLSNWSSELSLIVYHQLYPLRVQRPFR